MTAIERQQIGRRSSQACVYGPTVYLAGQVADDPAVDVTEQTQQIFRKVDKLLEGAGTDKSRLLSAAIWLSDMASFARPGNGRSRSPSSRRDNNDPELCKSGLKIGVEIEKCDSAAVGSLATQREGSLT